ncbi:hypothetical protein [Nesterenkonia sp. PF2B19]|uniref:hypothetical protein n=1 Tax=Nesterenkonia sp. PF2B19 TaxID=1881858 RepID=UPI001481F97E|nr:hypothetical protein [Nesterenkonia sp. PF2B19]
MRLTTPMWHTRPCEWDGCPERSEGDGLCAEHLADDQESHAERLWEMEEGR